MLGLIILTAIVLSSNALEPDAPVPFLGPQQVNALPSVPADQRIHYGHNAEQFGDLRLPRGVPARVPVAVVLHGGCWKARHGDLLADLSGLIHRLGIVKRTDDLSSLSISPNQKAARCHGSGVLPLSLPDLSANLQRENRHPLTSWKCRPILCFRSCCSVYCSN
jgi:hypothetical protein